MITLCRAMIDMPQPRQILASAAAALMFFMLTACGQTGGLYLPQTPKGVERATLGQTLLRWPGHDAADEDDVPAATAAAAKASAASAADSSAAAGEEDTAGEAADAATPAAAAASAASAASAAEATLVPSVLDDSGSAYTTNTDADSPNIPVLIEP